MIKNLIFDFGKVLVDYDYMIVINQIFNTPRHLTGEVRGSVQDFCSKILTEEWGYTLDKEDKPFMEIIHDMQKAYPEYWDEIQQFGNRYHEFVTGEVPGMRDLLTRLKSEGYKLYGLTNWCSPVYKTMERYKEIFSLLDGRIISSEEKLIKPQVEIYERLCEKYDLKPEECIFADDKIENIEGAKKAGLKTILFKDAEQYEKELREIIR